MTGGAGHLTDMNKRIEQNRKLLKDRGYFKIKEAYLKISKKSSIEISKATPEQLKAVRQKVKQYHKQALIRNGIIMGLAIIGALLISGILVFWFMFW